jgi:hypothetical protein
MNNYAWSSTPDSPRHYQIEKQTQQSSAPGKGASELAAALASEAMKLYMQEAAQDLLNLHIYQVSRVLPALKLRRHQSLQAKCWLNTLRRSLQESFMQLKCLGQESQS